MTEGEPLGLLLVLTYSDAPADYSFTVSASVDGGAWQTLSSHDGYEYPLDFLGSYRNIKFRVEHDKEAIQQLIITGWEIETKPTRTDVMPGDTNTDSTVSVYASVDGGEWQELESYLNMYSLDSLGQYKNIKFRIRHNAAATQQLIINNWEIKTFPVKIR